MNTQNTLLLEAEILLYNIKRLQPPPGSRLAKLQLRAYLRYIRRFTSSLMGSFPVAAGRSPACSKTTGVIGQGGIL